MGIPTTDCCMRWCHKCGTEWNVSAKVKLDKQYICPVCRAVKKAGGEKHGRIAADQGNIRQKSL